MHTNHGIRVSSFTEFFRSEVSYVHRTLARLGVASSDLEDGVQEVFLSVHRHWAGRDPTRPIRPWLFAFAFHYAANHRRLGRHCHGESAGLEVLMSDDDPERALAISERRALVLRALADLPVERRDVFVACELDELPVKDAAELFSVPVGTVQSRLRIAREESALAAKRAMRAGERP